MGHISGAQGRRTEMSRMYRDCDIDFAVISMEHGCFIL